MLSISKIKLKILTALICAAAGLALAANAQAATYYVATTGNNAHTKTQAQNVATPWKTITYAISQMLSGDTAIIRGGTYVEQFSIYTPGIIIKNFVNEQPVIDGQEQIPNSRNASGLVNILASDVVIDGLTLKRSKDTGIWVGNKEHPGHRVEISNVDVSGSWTWGIIVDRSNNVVVEDSNINANALISYYRAHPSQRPDPDYDYSGQNGGSVSVLRGSGFVIRRSKIHDSWGEGLGFYPLSEHALAEDCEIYGHKVIQVYISDSRNSTIRRCLVYGSKGDSGRGGELIGMGGEDWAYNPEYNTGHRVYGNLLANGKTAIRWAGESLTGPRNTRVFNNTLAYMHSDSPDPWYTNLTGIVIVTTNNAKTGHLFKNNAILQPDQNIDQLHSGKVTFTNNLWSRTPSSLASGPGDQIGTFTLSKTSGWSTLMGGDLTKQDFQLISGSSMANNRGGWLTTVSTAANNSTSIQVADAKWFHGDEDITFSNGQTAKLVGANYDTNVLTLTAAKTIPAGTSIQMSDFMGSTAPNIGPWTASNPADTTAPAVPSGLAVR